MGDNAGSSSVVRGLSVFRAVLDGGHTRAATIAEGTGLPVSTVYRHLRHLVEHEFVVERRGGYEAGPVLEFNSGGALSRRLLVEHSMTLLQRLAEDSGETSLGVTRHGLHGAVFAQVESGQLDRVAYHEGALLPLHAGAAQRAILAFSTDAVLRALLSKGIPRVTGATLGEAELIESLAEVRRMGVAVSNEELTHGGLAIAVPVFVAGAVVCSLCIQGPLYRCSDVWQERASAMLTRAAAELGRNLERALV